MSNFKTIGFSGIAACLALAAGSAQASVIVYSTTAQEFSVKRNGTTTAATAVVETSIHPKDASGLSTADRFAMIRFNSASLGSGVVAAELHLTTSTFTGPAYTFTIWGVTDSDAQDELIDETTYNPNAVGALYNKSEDMIDTTQVTNLGTLNIPASPASGTTFTFSTAALLSFLQADTNDVATIVVTRNTVNAGNSTFVQSDSTTDSFKPQLVLTIPEPASLALLGGGGLLIAGRRRRA